jgi:Na+/proline symporter
VINVAGLGYTYGWAGLTDALAISSALVLSAIFVVPRVFQQRNISLGGSLRVSGRLVNAATGLLSTVVYTLITAAQIVALIKVAQPFFPVPPAIIALAATLAVAAYVIYGGYNSVTVTDVIQFVVVGSCYFALVAWTLADGTATATAPAAAIAPRAMPADLMLLLVVPFLFVPVSQDLHIRINGARSQRDARIGAVLAGAIYLAFGIISVCVGRSLAASGVALATPDDAVATYLGLNFGTLAIIPTFAVLCVVVSSLDSVLFASASSLAYDFWDRLANRTTPHEKDSTHPRLATAIVLGVALLIALQAPRVLDLIISALVIYVSVLLPMLVGRMLGRQSRALGLLGFAALAGVIVLEIAEHELPFRVFIYTAVHLIAVLCLKKETPA